MGTAVMKADYKEAKTPISGLSKSGGAQRTLARNKELGRVDRAPGVQRRPDSQSELTTIPPVVREVLGSPGETLNTTARLEMESRFGHNFSQVRVHTDEKAAASAREINALAYTVGQDMVFGVGQYAPATTEGRKLLAHELTHTIQQGASAQPLSGDLKVSDPDSAAEREAHEVADVVMRGTEAASVSKEGPVIAREPPPAAVAKKKVTINVTNLNGAGGSIGSALTYANTRVYNQAQIEVEKGKEATLDEAKSKAILGDDLIVDEYSNPATPTAEERELLKVNQGAGAGTVYFVKGLSQGSLGESFWASSGSGLIGFVVGSTRSDNTFSHELGHVLLDDGGHSVPDATHLMHATAADPTKLTPEQITKIRASPFAK